MNASNELREQMWELCYDLLPSDQREALIGRIKSDPQVARLYAEVRLQADLVGFAAKVEDPSLILSGQQEELPAGDLAAAGGRCKEAAVTPLERSASSHAGRWEANWLTGAAALVLFGLIALGYSSPFHSEQRLAETLLVTEIDVPAAMHAGLSDELRLRSKSAQGNAVASEVDITIRDSSGQVRFHDVVATDSEGRGKVAIPGPAIVTGAQIVAAARSAKAAAYADRFAGDATPGDASANRLTARLPVRSEPPLVYYLFDQPVAVPGQTVSYGVMSLDRFTLQPSAPLPDQVEGASAGALPLQPEGTAEGAIAEGTFIVPADSSDDEAALEESRQAPSKSLQLKRELDKQVADGRRRNLADDRVTLRQRAGRDEQIAEDAPKQSAGLAGPGLLEQSETVKAKVEDGVALEQLERESVGQSQVVEAGQPLTVPIPAIARSKKLLVEAICRDVTVVSQSVDPSPSQAAIEAGDKAGQRITLDLPPEADGAIRVELVDQSQSPPQVLSQHHFFRQPAKELAIEREGWQKEYAPGEVVKLRLKVSDESGRATSATLGVRVWNEASIAAAGGEPPLLAEAVRLSSQPSALSDEVSSLAKAQRGLADLSLLAQSEVREDLVEAKKTDPVAAPLASPAPASPAASEAEVAPSRTAGTPVPPAEAPSVVGGAGVAEPAGKNYRYAIPAEPAEIVAESKSADSTYVASNETAVLRQHRLLKSELERDRKAWQAMLGRVLVIGGVAALATLFALFLVRMPVRAGSGTFALVAAAASLVIGAFWMSDPQHESQVALAIENGTIASTQPKSAATESPFGFGRGHPAGQEADFAAGADALAPPSADQSRPLAAASAPDALKDAAPATSASSSRAMRPTDPAGIALADKPVVAAQATPAPAAPLPADAEAVGARAGGAFGRPPPAEKSAEKLAAGKEAGGSPLAEAGRGFGSATRMAKGAASGSGAGGGKSDSGTATAGLPPLAPAADLGRAGRLEPSAAPAQALAGAATQAESRDNRPQSPAQRGGRGADAAPPALYFNPRLMTDEQGYATIEFQLPQVESQYRVLIDAFGQGRIGSVELPIVCQQKE
jgi:hypothetical protein